MYLRRKLSLILLSVMMIVAMMPLGAGKAYAANGTSINNAAVVFESATLTYNGKAQKPVIKTIGGMTLTQGVDYTADWQNASSTNAGNYKVTIQGIGNYTGKTRAQYTIKAKRISPTIVLSKNSFTFNGAAQKPTVTVKDGTTTIPAASYKATVASGKDVGKYSVKVELKGNYEGNKTVYFKIIPKGTSIKSLSRASKAFKVKWTKQTALMSTARVTGYEIQRATNKKFTKGKKTIRVKGYSKVSKKVSKLKAKKKYYVRVRTYMVVNGAKYCSKWSKVKAVTTK